MENVLTPQQRSLAIVACLEAQGDIERLRTALHAALDNHLTVSQLKEALSHLYAYTGFPRSLNALGALQQVVAERKADGRPVVEGREADPLPANFDALAEGTKMQTRLTGQPFNYAFAPQTDYYLKAHLFGDIFARNNLSPAERELVTVAALSGMEGVAPQLAAHKAGALNMGLTEAQVESIALTLQENHLVPSGLGGDKPWPVGEKNEAYAQYFIGQSYLAPLSAAQGGPVNVTFEPRCRNNWHVHHGAVQVLICVSGRGWYQEWGKEAVEMRPGTVIAIPAEAKHWHGAAKDSWFQHLTYMANAEPGASNEWLEPVEDAAYNLLP